MTKGASIKFQNYEESVSKILKVLNLANEIKKYDKIILKLSLTPEMGVPQDFVEEVLKFCLENKNPVSDIFIAEGVDGKDTMEVFEEQGFVNLAEKYSIGLIDLNNTETEEIENHEFERFEKIHYPKILLESFIISLSHLKESEEGFSGTLSSMLGAFPAKYYKGFFSSTKNKIKKFPIKYAIHDINKCKAPDFAIVDGSEQGVLLAGLPLEVDKQMAKILDKDWKLVPYLKLMSENYPKKD